MSAPLLNSYQNWLKSKNYSDATIRNYLVDLRKYLLFTNSNLDQITDKIFNSDNLTAYLQNINQDQNYKRFLASLSKFFHFALDQKLISDNPFPKAIKIQPETSLEDIIKLYQKTLEKQKFSILTIKNYINDIQQFINWAQNPSPTPPLDRAGAKSAPLSRGAVRRTEGFVK